MVEGPGCTLNGEKIRARVSPGQAVQALRGSAVTSQKSNAQPFPSRACVLPSLVGCSFTGVETLGKELFLYFGAKSLRVHFGMNGSMRINPTENKDRNGHPAALELKLARDVICFYDSTFDIRNALDCQEKAGLLTDAQVSHLVKMTRDFTLLFYKCRKSGAALYKHYKVYKKPNCGQCGAKITVCRLGENNRMTYFCPGCQKDNPQRVDVSKLPTRNSLIGWACRQGSQVKEDVARRDEEQWSCGMCTLINKPSDKQCDACLTPRPQGSSSVSNNDTEDIDIDLVKYPCNNFGKPLSEVKLNRRTAFGNVTLVMSDFSTNSTSRNMNTNPLPNHNSLLETSVNNEYGNSKTTSKRRDCENEQGANTFNMFNGGLAPDNWSSLNHPQKKMKNDDPAPKCNSSISSPVSSPRVNLTGGTSALNKSSPLCGKHQRPCTLQVVRKDGDNKGRQFYTCSLPRETRCEFFEWADLHFPSCHHAKRCVMRTVLKIGPNNGKNFYSCPLGKDKQCGFFEWAK
ncbi:endonuclease 8-like 3 isoform X2 [Spea bombifrons]|uniref:endonuclease 8-like 3 isoform X2 n=1 Tax=Spea bombifrons TaxID=233779 RepID=UPI00234928D4|nr:endonuclease 8-like 3 isoform X2 [Spea bombifrons]